MSQCSIKQGEKNYAEYLVFYVRVAWQIIESSISNLICGRIEMSFDLLFGVLLYHSISMGHARRPMLEFVCVII